MTTYSSVRSPPPGMETTVSPVVTWRGPADVAASSAASTSARKAGGSAAAVFAVAHAGFMNACASRLARTMRRVSSSTTIPSKLSAIAWLSIARVSSRCCAASASRRRRTRKSSRTVISAKAQIDKSMAAVGVRNIPCCCSSSAPPSSPTSNAGVAASNCAPLKRRDASVASAAKASTTSGAS